MTRKSNRHATFVALLACVGLAIGCGSGGGPTGDSRTGDYCWDECDVDETACSDGREKHCELSSDGCLRWSSPRFCPSGLVCVADKCDACERHSQCASTDVCVARRCEPASGREYSFTFLSASIPERDAEGYTWDAAGMPDPYVELHVDGGLVGRTRTKQDTLSPVWNESLPFVRIHAASEVIIRLYDEDPVGRDYIDSVRLIDPLDFVRSGEESGLLHKNSKVRLSWRITAR